MVKEQRSPHLCGPATRRKPVCGLASLLCLPQDLFFKYTWNNFLHFQVELCIAAILSHAARGDRAEASGPDSRMELLPGNGDPETPQPAASLPENTMVTHVSPASVLCVAVCPTCPCLLSSALSVWLLVLTQAARGHPLTSRGVVVLPFLHP